MLEMGGETATHQALSSHLGTGWDAPGGLRRQLSAGEGERRCRTSTGKREVKPGKEPISPGRSRGFHCHLNKDLTPSVSHSEGPAGGGGRPGARLGWRVQEPGGWRPGGAEGGACEAAGLTQGDRDHLNGRKAGGPGRRARRQARPAGPVGWSLAVAAARGPGHVHPAPGSGTVRHRVEHVGCEGRRPCRHQAWGACGWRGAGELALPVPPGLLPVASAPRAQVSAGRPQLLTAGRRDEAQGRLLRAGVFPPLGAVLASRARW